MKIAFEVPIKTTSALNGSWGSWKQVNAKRKRERAVTSAKMPRFEIRPVFVVTLTRLSSGTLDDDNLRGATKSIRDAIAHRLGVDDGGPLIRWEYRQEKCERGEYAVRVEISEVAREGA